jgi:hypothetical protein
MEALLIIASIVSFFTKIGVHIHLDWKHNRFKGFMPTFMQPIEYFFFYTEDVKQIFESEKKICNTLYVIFLILIFLMFTLRLAN